MVEVGTFQVNEVRNWLGFRLDEVARWRETKASEYPDDERNANSAAALHAAARYVRTADATKSHGLIRLTRVIEAAHQSGIDLLQPTFAAAPLPGLESQRVTSRFGFDNLPTPPDAMDHEEFLGDFARAILRDLHERLFELDKDSPLAKLLNAEAPAVPADPAVALLTDLAEVLHESQRTHERERRHDRLAEISNLVVKVRDVALSEANPDGSLQSREVMRTFPQTRMELRIVVAGYEAETGQKLPASTELASGSTMTHVTNIVGGVTDALEELLREVATPTA